VHVAQDRTRLAAARARLGLAARARTRGVAQQLGAAAGRLNAVSPLNTLERGYAIVQAADGRIVRDAREVTVGEVVGARLARGSLTATVTGIAPAAAPLSGERRTRR
jgi:exodeoxyribonuclease VII large subunit